VFIFVGAVLLCVLIIASLVLFGGFGNFAFNLGEKTLDISVNEQSRFIGAWSGESENSIIGNKVTFYSDGMVGLHGRIPDFETYSVDNGVLEIMLSGMVYFYNYEFSNNDNILKLSDVDSNDSTFYYRVIED